MVECHSQFHLSVINLSDPMLLRRADDADVIHRKRQYLLRQAKYYSTYLTVQNIMTRRR